MGAVAVLQSHTSPLPASWYETCTGSVRNWAAVRGFEYRWMGDELFELLSPELREKTRNRLVVASDLARLLALTRLLESDYDRVIWVDADTLVIDPQSLTLPDVETLFGREVWIQWEGNRLRCFRKIHNAFMAFTRTSSVLPFYRYAAERILQRHTGPMAPQIIGPKLLTMLHNVVHFDVLEAAGMLSPAVCRDLLDGGGKALERFSAETGCRLFSVNLCGSAVAGGELSDVEVTAVTERLLNEAGLLHTIPLEGSSAVIPGAVRTRLDP